MSLYYTANGNKMFFSRRDTFRPEGVSLKQAFNGHCGAWRRSESTIFEISEGLVTER